MKTKVVTWAEKRLEVVSDNALCAQAASKSLGFALAPHALELGVDVSALFADWCAVSVPSWEHAVVVAALRTGAEGVGGFREADATDGSIGPAHTNLCHVTSLAAITSEGSNGPRSAATRRLGCSAN